MSLRKFKVYGWRGWRNECEPAPNGSHQTREIVAATSLAAAARAAGEKGPWALDCVSETGNAQELDVALGSPNTVFWRSLNDNKGPFRRAKVP